MPHGGSIQGADDVVVIVLAGVLGACLSAVVGLRFCGGLPAVRCTCGTCVVEAAVRRADCADRRPATQRASGAGLVGSRDRLHIHYLCDAFGYAQQIVTGPVDRQVQKVLSYADLESPSARSGGKDLAQVSADIPGAVAESVQASLAEVLRGDAVVNVEGGLAVSGEVVSSDQLVLR